MPPSPRFFELLAESLLAGAWTEYELYQRAAWAGDRSDYANLYKIVDAVLYVYPEEHPPESFADLVLILEELAEEGIPFPSLYPLLPLPEDAPERPRPVLLWHLPCLANQEELADWLGLYHDELPWLADIHHHEKRVPAGPLRHYVYRTLPKRDGRLRLIEMPKSLLKGTQQRILHHLLDRIPPHDAAHAFRKGRSIATFAAPHCGRDVVLRFDLKDFFPSVPAPRVHGIFRTVGYPVEVAGLLTGLCTNAVPDDAWPTATPYSDRQRFRSPHLPQGAPTSPALANLAAWHLDVRLSGLAARFGATYTRYADDLAVSGGANLERAAQWFHERVAVIAAEEGFTLNTRKTRVLRRGVRQRLAGVVVNQHLNVCRADYDTLKAILHNCARHGPASQNRADHADFRAHLLGRVAHVALLNPARGTKLRQLFAAITWR